MHKPRNLYLNYLLTNVSKIVKQLAFHKAWQRLLFHVLISSYTSWKSKKTFTRYVFPENVNEILLVVRKILSFVFDNISQFHRFLKLLENILLQISWRRQHVTRSVSIFYLQNTSNRFFINCIKSNWHSISSSWNINDDSNQPPPQKNTSKKPGLITIKINYLRWFGNFLTSTAIKIDTVCSVEGNVTRKTNIIKYNQIQTLDSQDVAEKWKKLKRLGVSIKTFLEVFV